MSTALVDFSLANSLVSNPDGSLTTQFIGCTPTQGPGSTAMGELPGALMFGPEGGAQLKLPVAALDLAKFCVRTTLKLDTPVVGRQNVVESTAVPLALFLDKSADPNGFQAVVSVAPQAHGWSGTSTEFVLPLMLSTWYTIDLLYDVDTVAVAVNGVVLSIHAFPQGTIQPGPGDDLFIGTWVDGARFRFEGTLAGLQVFSGLPPALETLVDEKRSAPEWFISYKYEQVRPLMSFGAPLGRAFYDVAIGATLQRFERGLIMHQEGMGAAFELHGAILDRYMSMSNREALGYLVSDEGQAVRPGSRKSLFSRGGIYWSGATGAVEVLGRIYLDYELLGDHPFLGLPTAPASLVSGGVEQVFEGGRMYHRTGSPRAFEVHGAILDRYLTTGAVAAWGFPTSDEGSVLSNGSSIGRSSDFEGCTIYWSPNTGAFEVHGDIRARYQSLGGPLSQLGFPTSNEQDIPGAPAPARHNTFQQGSILWFGSGEIHVCYPFQTFLGRIDSKEEEGWLMGQNDIYLRVIIHESGHEVFNRRYPDGGDFGGHNVIDVNTTVPRVFNPNSPSAHLTFTVDIWESDDGAPFGEGDDHLGTYQKVLTMANAWGLRENGGVFNTGAFSRINSMTWSVKPLVNESALTDMQKWWGVTNRGTATITFPQYAAAFRDVDSESEWWDVTDWLEAAFYELVAKGLAGSGNCFGMSLEAINARKHQSIFSLPLDRFTQWEQVRNEFNVKHLYQVGAASIWWFVGEFLSGNTRDPADVFRESWRAFNRGEDPVIALAQNWDFSGAPHVVLPIAWDDSARPWRMRVCDPNFTNGVREILIDPDANTFEYVGASTYRGAEWSGGRLYYLPYSVLNQRPRTPIWDAILLVLAGTIVVLGEDATTDRLTDAQGNDLNAFGANARARLKQGQPLDHQFVPFKGFGGGGAMASELFLRRPNPTSFRHLSPRAFELRLPAGITLGEVMALSRPAQVERVARGEAEGERARLESRILRAAVAERRERPVARLGRPFERAVRERQTHGARMPGLEERDVRSLLRDPEVARLLAPELRGPIERLLGRGQVGKDIRHEISGQRDGTLRYAVRTALSQTLLTTSLRAGERHGISIDDLETGTQVMKLRSESAKTARLEVEQRLGAGSDRIRVTLDHVPLDANGELHINARPGLGGLDLLASQAADVEITIETDVGGQPSVHRYGANLAGGVRLRPSTIFTDGSLQVGRIDNVFGPIRDVSRLRPR